MMIPSLNRLRFALLAPSLVVNPRNNARVIVYTKERLMYNRIKKSGNSSIMLFLDEILYGNQASDSNYEKAKNASFGRTTSPFKLPSREIRRLDDYYKFTIFRNPYTRCLSTFLNKVAPGNAALYSFVPGFGDDSARGFEKFIHFLEGGGTRSNPHFYSQTHLLFFRPEYFSRIGKLENLDLELRLICTDVGLPYPHDLEASAPHRVEQSCEGKVTKADRKLDMYYTKDLFDRVRDLYIADFEIGGYDTQPPP
jgi:hypothetical protein